MKTLPSIAISHPLRRVSRTHRAGRRLGIAAGVLGGLAGLLWAGVHVPPTAFPPVGQTVPATQQMPLPADLPAPVQRFYRGIYGDSVPLIGTAAISGRGTMRPAGAISLPMRFRFVHRAGQSYRHYLEATIFGVPIMRANEYYVDGTARMELPWGVDAGPTVDQAANLSLWGELAAWVPAALLSDPRVRWEALDDASAVLVVPFGAHDDSFVARFDPSTGRLRSLESLRYKNAGQKVLWLNEIQAWATLGGRSVPIRSSVTWADDGVPWLQLRVEDVAYNVAVDTSRAATGP